MQNKLLFMAAIFFLFVISALAGYFGPPMVREYRLEKRRESFAPPAVPAIVAKAFSEQFNYFSAATEPQGLPEDLFVDLTGKEVSFSDFAGRPTLVNFWATWCAPCVVELPSLERLASHYQGRMNVIAVALEPNKAPSDISKFLENRRLGAFAGYLDAKDTIGKKLGLRGIPTSFLIGSDGLILYRFEGDADWASKEAQDFFDIFLLQNR